ncbi:MAG: sugar ABC transporter permease [Anaerolineae bacterium]|nr:sugar ABC transporter permease [Anaerolineae bacterium]
MAVSTATPTETAVEKKALIGKTGQEWLAGYAFVTPALLVVLVFVFIPMIYAFFISFTDWTGLQPPQEANNVGFYNYQQLLVDDTTVRDEFFRSIKNTVYYVIGVVPTQTVIALLLAIIVNQKFLKGRGFFRTAFYFPSITSSIVIGLIFLWLFNRDGLINRGITGLSSLVGIKYTPVVWLNDLNGLIHNFLGFFGLNIRTIPDWMKTEVLGQTIWQWISGPSVTLTAIMVLAIWTTSGTMMLIFLAALQDIPGQLYEAAAVDGATRWQQFRHITVPMLRPTTFFVVTLGLIGTFQVFDQIYVISQGQPAGTTTTIAWIVYRNAFKDSQAGLGAATAFVLFVIILVFNLLQRRLTGQNKSIN